jgi:hypothetical protein
MQVQYGEVVPNSTISLIFCYGPFLMRSSAGVSSFHYRCYRHGLPERSDNARHDHLSQVLSTHKSSFAIQVLANSASLGRSFESRKFPQTFCNQAAFGRCAAARELAVIRGAGENSRHCSRFLFILLLSISVHSFALVLSSLFCPRFVFTLLPSIFLHSFALDFPSISCSSACAPRSPLRDA